MGSTMCKGVSLQDVLQLNQTETPKPQRLKLLTRVIQVTTNEIYNNIQYTQNIQKIMIHTLGPSMPQVAFTPLGLPSLASTHSST